MNAKHPPHTPSISSKRHSQGAALAVALILLVIITILGLASMRNTNMQERMTANFLDRSLAFQSAETGLRVIETKPSALAPPPIGLASNYPNDLAIGLYTDGVCNAGACNAAGYCPKPDQECLERVYDPAFLGWVNIAAVPALGAIAIAPQFYAEHMGAAPSWFGCEQEVPVNQYCLTERYRAASRSQAADRAEVALVINYTQP